MGKRFLDKMLGFMGFEEEEIEVLDDDRMDREIDNPPQARNNKKNNLVSLQTPKQMKVAVVEPTNFEESQIIADHLKNRRPVIVNLENTDHDLAKRIVDFMSGAIYALNGSLQKVGKGIFLFVPSNVEITGDIRDEAREKGFFSWAGRHNG